MERANTLAGCGSGLKWLIYRWDLL